MNKIYSEVIGSYYSPFIVKNILDELDEINNEDIQFVEHNVKEIVNKESIEIEINVFEGQKIIVEKIAILGNTVTNETVIRSSFLLDEGDPFSRLKVDKSISELKSKGIFASVKSNIKNGTMPNSKIIEISVEDMPTGEISAGAGVGTNGGSFAFNIRENNWLGRGITVSANADVSAETVEGFIEFVDPNYNFTGKQLSTILKILKMINLTLVMKIVY